MFKLNGLPITSQSILFTQVHYNRMSEYLVWQAGKQGLPITIYRPGMISWSMRNGKANKVI